eukprot:CAMPEP_0202920356 /NCGR_PEP_ID=MMETSP1392-20130828/76815_1 /ASSEMBLY_ACC=CAM_ASM_000868 /TAXON_ID=225041 /ORGANISM="Chlamydomonas chlamydogama, Strain SAG 11-48b" /LENGTH=494 /DNA_ID=CAMNT_0049613847 /DNA_START=1172 /DNA_END=2656 /DNA_ORIENTATION=-
MLLSTQVHPVYPAGFVPCLANELEVQVQFLEAKASRDYEELYGSDTDLSFPQNDYTAGNFSLFDDDEVFGTHTNYLDEMPLEGLGSYNHLCTPTSKAVQATGKRSTSVTCMNVTTQTPACWEDIHLDTSGKDAALKSIPSCNTVDKFASTGDERHTAGVDSEGEATHGMDDNSSRAHSSKNDSVHHHSEDAGNSCWGSAQDEEHASTLQCQAPCAGKAANPISKEPALLLDTIHCRHTALRASSSRTVMMPMEETGCCTWLQSPRAADTYPGSTGIELLEAPDELTTAAPPAGGCWPSEDACEVLKRTASPASGDSDFSSLGRDSGLIKVEPAAVAADKQGACTGGRFMRTRSASLPALRAARSMPNFPAAEAGETVSVRGYPRHRSMSFHNYTDALASEEEGCGTARMEGGEPGRRISGAHLSSVAPLLTPRGKKRSAAQAGGSGCKTAPNPNGHACTQCGTQSTPVWRAGPYGPKTLCNACGVRYMKVAKKK